MDSNKERCNNKTDYVQRMKERYGGGGFMEPDCTLVTGIFDLQHIHNSCRSLDDCIQLCEPVLSIDAPMVIYCSKSLASRIREKRVGFQKTQIIEQELNELWSFQYLSKVKKNRENYWPTRDDRTCAESHLVCCNKFDFVYETILFNPFQTRCFAWIDAFLGQPGKKGLRITESEDREMVKQILIELANRRKTEKFHIQCLSLVDPKYLKPENKREYYSVYRWVVCGGFFLTEGEIGIKIMNRLKEVFIETTEAGYGHGEEMFYLEVLDEFFDDLALSFGDYGQILDNFIYPRRNFWSP